MSALLAALKRAAEEKQKKNRQAVRSTSDEEGAANQAYQAPSQTELEPEPIPFQINFADDIAPNLEPQEGAVIDKTSPISETVDLDFVDDQLNTEVAEPAKSTALKTVMEDTSEEPLEKTDRLSQSEPVSDSENMDLIDAKATTEPPLVANVEQDSVEFTDEVDELEEVDEVEPPSIQSDADTDFGELKMVSESAEEEVEKENRLDLDTSLALNADGDTDTSFIKPLPAGSDAFEQKTEPLAEKPAEPFEKTEDWSLDQIPGYQQPTATQSDQAKMHRFIKAIQPAVTLKMHFSKKTGIGFVGVLVFLGLGYFGLSVYEKEFQLLEQDLKQYQSLAKTPRTNLPLSIPSSSDQQPSKVSNGVVQKTAQWKGSEPSETNQPISDPSSTNALSDQKDSPKLASSAMQTSTPKVKTHPFKAPTSKSSNKLEPKQATDPRFKIEAMAPRKEVFLGYEAYTKGDYAASERYYQQAYQASPESLPVLFGLAATAAKKGETQKALAAYQKILKKEPYNQDAKIAVATLKATSIYGSGVRERLEDLARNSPENAQLQSALGHQYAKKQNWVEAQKYYFKAYELAQQNGTYALNLAVSLDRLGQYSLAKQYYEQALIQSDHAMSPATQKQIKNRLLAIQQHFHQEFAR